MSAVEQSPLERRARHLSRIGGQTGPCLRFVLGLLDQSRADLDAARREIDRLHALTLEQARLKTLGGIPPRPDITWANRGINAGVHPDYTHLAEKTP